MTARTMWEPPLSGSTNVERFMTRHGIGRFDELLHRSIDEPEWFWDAVVRFLGIPFAHPYADVLDDSGGIAWARWFTEGTTNAALACVDRWADDPGTASRVAVLWEGEDGAEERWTYGELRRRTDAFAHRLAGLGVGEGDVVGVFLPMLPETIAVFMAVAKVGAATLPLFSGFGPEAIAVRLRDAGAVVLVTTSTAHRRGRQVPMRETATEALRAAPKVRHCLVVERSDEGLGPLDGGRFDTRAVGSESPLLLAYTSGTTGRPKGAVLVHGGFTVKCAEEAAFQLDVTSDDRLFWFSDFGWIMGAWECIGGLAAGATVCLYEGAPDWPDPSRLWRYLEHHRVSALGISPTLVRSMMAHGEEAVAGADLSALRMLGSTGEPWNEDPWHWYFERVGGGRCPVINFSGGTEVGGCFLSPHPVQPLTPMTLGGPSLGMAVDVFDEAGRPLREGVGELVCTRPWPAMTRGLWGDPDRYLDTYWSRWPGVWVHGDWASIEDGHWYLHGRSDDTIKISGKRLGPAEVESVLVSDPAVVEAAAVGVPDEATGEQLWAFVVPAEGTEPSAELAARLGALVGAALGKSFRPRCIGFTEALPKTRNAKVLRRAIRGAVLGRDPGDLSSLDDSASLDALDRAVRFPL